MHQWVQGLLRKAEDEESFLRELCHCDSINHPVAEVGNEDVPTIVVNWKTNMVSFEWISLTQEMVVKYNLKMTPGVWPMAQFIAEPPNTFRSWYE